MKESSAKSAERRHAATPVRLGIGLGWRVEAVARELGAVIELSHPQQAGISVEITITASGPVIRAQAHSLELTAVEELSTSCRRFELNATDEITLSARKVAVAATHGSVQLKANDDVQLLGEQILLNCDRDPPLPSWVPRESACVTLPRADVGGDTELLTENDHAP